MFYFCSFHARRAPTPEVDVAACHRQALKALREMGMDLATRLHARADDKFWAAQKLMSLTTDLLRAAIKAGDFRDPASEEFLVRALAERRDAIGRAYLTAVNPIADPSLDDAGVLTFRNASVDADAAEAAEGDGAVPAGVVDGVVEVDEIVEAEADDTSEDES